MSPDQRFHCIEVTPDQRFYCIEVYSDQRFHCIEVSPDQRFYCMEVSLYGGVPRIGFHCGNVWLDAHDDEYTQGRKSDISGDTCVLMHINRGRNSANLMVILVF